MSSANHSSLSLTEPAGSELFSGFSLIKLCVCYTTYFCFGAWRRLANLKSTTIMVVINRASQSFLTHARVWYLIDAKDQVCGRLASFIAQILQGKTKPIYHHAVDVGDYVVVVNTKDVVLTGSKWDKKLYRHHTGYPRGLKEIRAKVLHKKDQTRVLWRAVNGMLPKNNLRPVWMKRLYLFEGENHPYAENIFAKLEAPSPLPRRLHEYTAEEIASYPKLF